MTHRPFDVRRPFTRAAGLEAGLSPKVLRGPRFRRLLRGVLVDSTVPHWDEERIDAALLLFDGSAAASHASAARLLDVPIPTCPHEHVTVVDARDRRRREGVICHVDPSLQVDLVRGRRVAAATTLFVQLAESLDLVDVVVVGDHLVRRGRATVESLRSAAAAAPGPVGRRARAAASYVRAGVDSPMETRLRMLLVLAGLPEPQVNLTIRDVDGQPVRRFDLSWPGVKVIVESDGRHHIVREETWERDLDRREWDGRRRLATARRHVPRDLRRARADGRAGVRSPEGPRPPRSPEAAEWRLTPALPGHRSLRP